MRLLAALLIAVCACPPAGAAVDFEADDSVRFSVASTPVTAAPLTISCWVRAETTPASFGMVYIGNADGTHGWMLHGTNTYVDFLVWAGATPGQAYKLTAVSTTAWTHLCGVETASNSRQIYYNGTAGTADATSRAPSGSDRIVLGRRGADKYLDGLLSDVAIWNVALTVSEVASLAAGASPASIRTGSLVFWAPCSMPSTDATSPYVRDVVGGLSLAPGVAGNRFVGATPVTRTCDGQYGRAPQEEDHEQSYYGERPRGVVTRRRSLALAS